MMRALESACTLGVAKGTTLGPSVRGAKGAMTQHLSARALVTAQRRPPGTVTPAAHTGAEQPPER